MTDFAIGVLVGGLAVLVLSAIAVYALRRHDQRGRQRNIDALEAQIVELRKERTEDKEVNRRLRRDLASSAPGNVPVATPPAATKPAEDPKGEPEPDHALADAVDKMTDAQRELADAQARCRDLEAELVDRDEKLTRYRESLREIRQALEVRDATATAGSLDAE